MQLPVHISCWIQNFLMHWWDHSKWVVTGYSLPLTNRQGGSTSGNIKMVVFFYCNECQRWWRTSTYLSFYCCVWMARPKHQWWKMGVFGPTFGQYTCTKWFGENKIYQCSLRLTKKILIILHYNVYSIKPTAFQRTLSWGCLGVYFLI